MEVPVRIKFKDLSARERYMYRYFRQKCGLSRSDANAAFFGYFVAQKEAQILSMAVRAAVNEALISNNTEETLRQVVEMLENLNDTIIGTKQGVVSIEPDHQ